jgi:hypothetical protein
LDHGADSGDLMSGLLAPGLRRQPAETSRSVAPGLERLANPAGAPSDAVDVFAIDSVFAESSQGQASGDGSPLRGSVVLPSLSRRPQEGEAARGAGQMDRMSRLLKERSSKRSSDDAGHEEAFDAVFAQMADFDGDLPEGA